MFISICCWFIHTGHLLLDNSREDDGSIVRKALDPGRPTLSDASTFFRWLQEQLQTTSIPRPLHFPSHFICSLFLQYLERKSVSSIYFSFYLPASLCSLSDPKDVKWVRCMILGNVLGSSVFEMFDGQALSCDECSFLDCRYRCLSSKKESQSMYWRQLSNIKIHRIS